MFAHKPEGGQMDTEDQVKRLRRFTTEHSEWQVLSPQDVISTLRGETEWRASSTDGQFVHSADLRDLLDQMEERVNGEGAQ